MKRRTFKLGNIALEQANGKKGKEQMNKNDEETIEIVEEDIVDLEAIVKYKLKGFRRTSPTSTPQAENNERNYSQAASSSPTDKQAHQDNHHQGRADQKKSEHGKNISDRKAHGIRYCHHFYNGKC